MMYSNNFAAAILVNGKVLREFGDTVYLPFGSEYSIRLKNLNPSRAKVTIEIDGECVTDGSVVVGSFSTLDLERFIRNGNLDNGNRFKFIERSSKIEEHRGIKVEDGIVSLRYEFESSPVPLIKLGEPYKYHDRDRMAIWGSAQCNSVPVSLTQSAVTAACAQVSPQLNDVGITVEGSLSSQKFSGTYWLGSDGKVNSMNIRLLGATTKESAISEPVTVKTKAKCKTCGKLNKATAKFCSDCGTSLQIV